MNKITEENKKWAANIDLKFADKDTEYGANKKGSKWIVNLWQPLAKNIEMIIFEKDSITEKTRVKGTFNSPNWSWEFTENMDGLFYQYEITQEDGSKNLAMDPFAKSMAAFDWEAKDGKIGKAAFVEVKKRTNLTKLEKINMPQPIIYEAHVRDLTSQRKDVKIPGSFNALREIDFGKYLNDLNITHIQFLPIHNCYTLDEENKEIIGREKGSGWATNYNWGYDPHNYFSINGWYSSNPSDPYSRINEFNDLVDHMHQNDVKVICDVVYNHLYDNNTFNAILPGYYFREGSEVTPVVHPALASERIMVRRLIIESLKHFVEVYDVDGFRFDLLTFTDTETLKQVAKELREIKPNIVLHGEAWKFTDLEHTNSYTKGVTVNDDDFAYFNDTTRNSIKGADDTGDRWNGLIAGNMNFFEEYVSSVIGNNPDFKEDVPFVSKEKYDLFANTPNIILNYAACHDGHTLWDKVNLTVEGDLIRKLEAYRQAIIMQQFLQGRSLFLEGTEILYTKPHDSSGRGEDRGHESSLILDLFNLETNKYNENSYKTTDFVNGLRWDNISKHGIKENVWEFMSKINKFRISTPFFNLSTIGEINKYYKINLIDKNKGVIDFEIEIKGEKVRIIHNFSNDLYEFNAVGEIMFDSKIEDQNTIESLKPFSSILIKVS